MTNLHSLLCLISDFVWFRFQHPHNTAEIIQSQETKDPELYQSSQSFEMPKVAAGLARLASVGIQIKHW